MVLNPAEAPVLSVSSGAGGSTRRNPLSYVTLAKNATVATRSQRLHVHSTFDVTFTLHDGRQHVRLALEPNRDILQDGLVETTLGADGRVKEARPLRRADHKIYKGFAFVRREGHSEWVRAGWARIVIYRDGKHPLFDGSFGIDGDIHHVHMAKQYRQLRVAGDPVVDDDKDSDEVMVVWRDSDIVQPRPSHHGELRRHYHHDEERCGADGLAFNSYGRFQAPPSRHGLVGRTSIDGGGSGAGAGIGNLTATIGSTSGCPSLRKVALVGVAVDCTYWQGFDSKDDMRQQILSVVNQASQVYESSFNISLGLRNLTISEDSCPAAAPKMAPWNVACGAGVDLTDRLSDFSAWRGQWDDGLAYWTLLTDCASENAVGLSWLGQLCRKGSSKAGPGSNETVAGANVVVRTSAQWQVFAHETGHTFGAVHDCTANMCPVNMAGPSCCPLSDTQCSADGRFIMNPSTNARVDAFSPCSIGEICGNLKGRVDDECLVENQNVTTISGGQCGNGIVEAGEQCDCGGDAGCQGNPCCDGKTCMFKAGAVCDPTNEDCCTDGCQFAPNGTVCRQSTGRCDVAETCPADQHERDGTPCGSGGLECASGQCTSRDTQCQSLLGGTSQPRDTSACRGSSGCQVSCQNAAYGSGTCVVFHQNFLDGTPCGSGSTGRCDGGECRGVSSTAKIKGWIDGHKDIFIPVVVLVVLVVLLGLGACIFRCLRRRRRPKTTAPSAAHRSGQEAVMSGAQAVPFPPQEQHRPSEVGQDPWMSGRAARYA